MSIVGLVIVLLIVGVAMQLFDVDPFMKKCIYVVTAVVVIIVLLGILGLLPLPWADFRVFRR